VRTLDRRGPEAFTGGPSETAARSEPSRGLAGYGGDAVEVLVVVQDGHLRALGSRRDQEVRVLDAALVRSSLLSEPAVDIESPEPLGLTHGALREGIELLAATVELMAIPRLGEELELDHLTREDLECNHAVIEVAAQLGSPPRPDPGAGVGELGHELGVGTYARAAHGLELLRVKIDELPVRQASESVTAHRLLERPADRVRGPPSTEDLACTRHELGVEVEGGTTLHGLSVCIMEAMRMRHPT